MGKGQLAAVFQRQMEQVSGLKQVIFNNDSMGELPPLARLLFAGLWCLVDNEGCLEDRPGAIRKALVGYDKVSTGQVDEMLQSLHDRAFIVRYSRGGSNYIQVNNFNKYNKMLLRKQSQIPPPEF
ncbi:MAG: hypothetical protein KBA08_06185 [Firmicutes bacterium]|nr:hypothetical protein [Bacillota bacterium]